MTHDPFVSFRRSRRSLAALERPRASLTARLGTDQGFPKFLVETERTAEEEVAMAQQQLRLMRSDVRKSSGRLPRIQTVMQVCPEALFPRWSAAWMQRWVQQGLVDDVQNTFKLDRGCDAYMVLPFPVGDGLFAGCPYPETMGGVTQGMWPVGSSELHLSAIAFQLWVDGARKVYPQRLAPMVVEVFAADGSSSLRVETFGEKWDLPAATLPSTRSSLI